MPYSPQKKTLCFVDLNLPSAGTVNDRLVDLINRCQCPRITSLVCDVYDSLEFVELPIFSMNGLRIPPIELDILAGALVETSFIVTTQNLKQDIDCIVSSVDVVQLAHGT